MAPLRKRRLPEYKYLLSSYHSGEENLKHEVSPGPSMGPVKKIVKNFWNSEYKIVK